MMGETKYLPSGGLAFSEETDMKKLERLAREGWAFDRFSFMGFKLKKTEPQEIQYAMDYRKGADSDYFAFFEEAGWRHEGSFGEYIHLFSAPIGMAPIFTEKVSILEKYQMEKKSMGKAALVSLLFNIAVAVVLFFLQDANELIKSGFVILQGLTLIGLVFTGLPFLGYLYKVRKWKRTGW
jgi:hypothetical protein